MAAPTIETAIRFLAGRCDGAVSDDGAGFNGVDAPFGHRLSRIPATDWTPRQTYAAWKMVRKYRGQLADGGIDFDAIAEPAKPTGTNRSISRNGSGWVVEFPYDADLVSAVKRLPGRRWNPTRKVWTVPASESATTALLDFAETYDFEVEGDTAPAADVAEPEPPSTARRVSLDGDRLAVEFPYDAALVSAVKQVDRSRRWDSDRKVWTFPLRRGVAAAVLAFATENGFEVAADVREAIDAVEDPDPVDEVDVEIPELGLDLYPFQREAVEFAVRNRRAIVGHEMGLGKTPIALATIAALDAYPALVVVPASMKRTWARETRKWTPSATPVVLEGTTPDPAAIAGADVVVINYDVLDAWKDALADVDFEAFVADESHYLKNPKALRTKAARKISDGIDVRLLLSGTPIVNRPSELAEQLRIAGRLESEFGGWYSFVREYCGAYRMHIGGGRYVWNTDGATNLDDLYERLRERTMVRRTKAEVLPDLPSVIDAVIELELSNRDEYDAAESDLIAWLRERASEVAEFEASLAGLSDEETKRRKSERMLDAETKARRAEHLVRINALRRISARGKIDATKAWIADALEADEGKILVFGWHKEVVDALATEFGAPKITGDESGDERTAVVDRFQSDPECRLVVLNVKAGGVGLTMTAATRVAFVELPWTPGDVDQAIARCYGRLNDLHGATAYYLVGEKTIDESMLALIQAKRSTVDAVTDGAPAARTSILGDLVRSLVDPGREIE